MKIFFLYFFYALHSKGKIYFFGIVVLRNSSKSALLLLNFLNISFQTKQFPGYFTLRENTKPLLPEF